MTVQQSNEIGFILKGYPRLSETFIAQEILELERCGFNLHIFSLRPPREKVRHKINDQIKAQITYLPEHLSSDPLRTFSSLYSLLGRKNFYTAFAKFLTDCRYSFSWDRVLRFAQAVVLASGSETNLTGLHAHFLHSPATVARYASIILGLNWSCSAHAVDIWTLEDLEIRRKLEHMQWLVTCTQTGKQHLAKLSDAPDKLHLVYHGIDLERFSSPKIKCRAEDGVQEDEPVILLSVGRLVEKKGYDILLEALAGLPRQLNWQWIHVGDGVLERDLNKLAEKHKLTDRISWLGPRIQEEVLELYRKSDIFILPSRIAANGDRDGLPNVLMEAQSQAVVCLTTNVSAIPELIENDVTGILVPPDNTEALKNGLLKLIEQPELRQKLGRAGQKRVATDFAHTNGIRIISQLFLKSYPNSQY